MDDEATPDATVFLCSETFVFYYCVALASAYVGALYLLVPSNVRKLSRDHPRQIQYRSIASLVVSLAAIASCAQLLIPVAQNATYNIVGTLVFRLKPVLNVITHTATLYFGGICTSILRIYEFRKSSSENPSRSFPFDLLHNLVYPGYLSALQPRSEQERWKTIRNFLVAPLTEEIVFRASMVPAMIVSGMSTPRIVLVAPLFFGVAHFHHAITRMSKGESFVSVAISTAFQFLYTSLFGSYAVYAFLRTGSLLAVIGCHAYCNWMGLPDLSFLQAHHPLHSYRYVLLLSYILGVATFVWLFSSGLVLPLPPALPSLLLLPTACTRSR